MKASELFLTRAIEDPEIIAECRRILDEWSAGIPFSPIKKLGPDTRFVSAVEHAAYKTTVTSQIERRSVKRHRVPYHGQGLPRGLATSADPDAVALAPFADFARHHRSEEIFDTRRKSDCSDCRATGEVTCPDCSGSGLVDCGHCDGKGFNWCDECGHTGQITKTRTRQREVECLRCDGKGWYTIFTRPDEREDCSTCSGHGRYMEDEEEEYPSPCLDCAASGRIFCDPCRGRAQVTCDECDGARKITCPDCDGHRMVMSYETVEVEEEPSSGSEQYLPPGLPKFNMKGHPLSNLKGPVVFSQDEPNRIGRFSFPDQPAAQLLSGIGESCRAGHGGKILRQRIEVEACGVLEYRYEHLGRQYPIYINRDHRLVGDVDGPVQAFVSDLETLAEKGLQEGRFEDAYRLASRALCMGEATEAEKQLRDRALNGLLRSYRSVALASWLFSAMAWYLASVLLPPLRFGLWDLLGLPLLLASVPLVAKDIGLRLSGPTERCVVAALLGVAFFLIGAGIGVGDEWVRWAAPAASAAAIAVFARIRSKDREMHARLEAHLGGLGSPQAREAHVLGFDPKPAFSGRMRLGLLLAVTLLSILPSQRLVRARRPLGALEFISRAQHHSDECRRSRYEGGLGRLKNRLLGVDCDQGPKEQSEARYERALGFWEKNLGPDSSMVATGLNNLGVSHFGLGHYEQAEPLYARATAIWGRTPSRHQPYLATGLVNFAMLHHAQGRPAKAKAALDDATALGAGTEVDKAREWWKAESAERAMHAAAEARARADAQARAEALAKAKAEAEERAKLFPKYGFVSWQKPEDVAAGRRSGPFPATLSRNDSEVMSFAVRFKGDDSNNEGRFLWHKSQKEGTWTESSSRNSGKWFLLPSANPKVFEGKLSNGEGLYIPMRLEITREPAASTTESLSAGAPPDRGHVAIGGRWDGVYRNSRQPEKLGPFAVVLSQYGEDFSGHYSEGAERAYLDSGQVAETGYVVFIVHWKDAPPINFVGQLSADGARIEGRWEFTDQKTGSGTFEMTRR